MSGFEEMGRVRKDFGGPETSGGPAVMAGSPPAVSVTARGDFADPKQEGVHGYSAKEDAGTFDEEYAFESVGVGQNTSPKFMFIDVDGSTVLNFSEEYNPSMITQNCIADKQMLLEYMVATERRYNITMSFPAYGVDPIVFDEVVLERQKREAVSDAEGDSADKFPPIVPINVKGRQTAEGQEPAEMYEKIEVDNILYLSCISECLDKEYLHKVIAEATEAVYMHGVYIYTMVGPKPLTIDGEAQGEFIETLKLNSYELSVLVSYMQKIEGVKVYHGVFNGRSAIKFEK